MTDKQKEYILKELERAENKINQVYYFLTKININGFLNKSIWKLTEIGEIVSTIYCSLL